MNKRAIAAISAAVLALLGVLVLVLWAQGANDRAFEGAKLVSVVRLTDDVPSGTSAADLADKTEVVKLPDEAVPGGAVARLDQVSGLSTNASVQKGELLLESRMAEPGSKAAKGDGGVPKGLQEVSVALDPERSVGGSVKTGDKVGVFVTAELKDSQKQLTNAVLDQVLVTKVSTTVASGDNGAITGTMVTLAVNALDAEKIVHAQKWGVIWLTLQNSDTDTSGSKLVTGGDVLK